MRLGLELGMGSQIWAQECQEEGGSWERHRHGFFEKIKSTVDICLSAKEAACEKGHIEKFRLRC